MDVPRRIERSRIILVSLAAIFSGVFAGCSQWDLSPSDYWPSKETWEKLSPSNIWYELTPSRLQRLNQGSPGMSSDVYYSVSDPIPPDPGTPDPNAPAVIEPVPDSVQRSGPAENASAGAVAVPAAVHR